MSTPTTAPARPPAPGKGGPLKDKRVLYGGAAVVAVAAFALWQRSKNAGSSTAAQTGSGTTGTDIASMLSDYNAQNQAALAGYVQQVQSLVGSVNTGTTSSTGNNPGVLAPGQKTSGSVKITNPNGGNVQEILRRYGITLDQFRALNKGLLLSPGHHGGAANLSDRLKAGTTVRIR